MLGKVFGVLCLLSVAFSLISGSTDALSGAILDGASGAVQTTLTLVGSMCFWCGAMQVLAEAGIIRRLARLLSPFLRWFFPVAYKSGEGIEEISANVSANLLGMGNAATPFALRAMEKLQSQNPTPEIASSEQITLAVLNTASFSLLPTTLMALRRTAGSARPYEVLLPVWITSALCATLALVLCRCMGKGGGKK